MKRRSAGFTILELMITITVLAILLGLAVPSFRQTIENNQLVSANNDFASSLNFTRSEALKRSSAVSLCASSDGAACSGSNDWSTGWIAFADTNSNGTLDGAETVLQAWPATDTNFSLTSSSPFVLYTSTGISPAAQSFDLLKSGCTGNHARQITISVTGRISTAVAACP